jgi:hypothetical protein
MIWLLPFVWVSVLVFGLIGLIQVTLGLAYFIWSVKEFINDVFDRDWNVKWRRRWLVEHFGEAGATRWLLNKKSASLYLRADPYIRHISGTNWFGDVVLRDSVNAYKKLQKLHAQYPWLAGEQVHRHESGATLGTVVQNWGGQQGHNSWCPPWGEDRMPYPTAHADEMDHEAVQSNVFNVAWHHGEPRWQDWMAAGYYDRGLEMFVKDTVQCKHRGEREIQRHLPMDVSQPLEDKAEVIYQIERGERREKKRQADDDQHRVLTQMAERHDRDYAQRMERAEAAVLAERAGS